MKKRFKLGNKNINVLGSPIDSEMYDFSYDLTKYDINNKNDSHAVICQHIEDNSTILDVGCATGRIGQIIHDFKTKCIIDGIEYQKDAYEYAKKTNTYRDLYNCSITDKKDKIYQEFINKNNKYDYIILGDVLEHLIEPWNVIQDLSKLLTKKGKILVSIPNICHIDIIRGLLDNEFNYNDVGILDSTHLLFFTEASFSEMINNIAVSNNVYFNIKKIGYTELPLDYVDENSKVYDELRKINKNINAIQILFELELTDEKNYKKYHVQKKDSYSILTDKIIENETTIEERDNLKEENKELKKYIKTLETNANIMSEDLKNLSNELNGIYNSKRWKQMNKLLKIIKK